MDIDYTGDVISQLKEAGSRDYVVNATWDDFRRTNEWRRYVSTTLRPIWSLLSPEARGLAYLLAHQEAMDEEWD